MNDTIPLRNQQWQIATFKEPIVFNRAPQETWLLNPVRRYVMNAGHLAGLEHHLASLSDLKSARYHRPLMAGGPIQGARVLIERYRDRGVGDMLFVTGPMAFLNHVTGSDIKIDFYGFADRGQILLHNPNLQHRTVLVGPTHYDDFQHYNYQWMIESVTECDEEPDQDNAYDALYRQIGIPPEAVDPRFKRPVVYQDQSELKDLDRFFYLCWTQRKVDLRRMGYYVVAPFTHSRLRLANYSTWIEIIREISKRRPTVVVGQAHNMVPDTDISVGEFTQKLDSVASESTGVIINAVNATPSLRQLVMLISRANCVFTIDTGPLYMAEALRVPAISLWGPHDPVVRLGYDKDYMDLAIWNSDFCANSPCFAHSGFPVKKCPQGSSQSICEVLLGAGVDDVLKKLNQVETRSGGTTFFLPHETAKQDPGAADAGTH